jgi:TonB family protein
MTERQLGFNFMRDDALDFDFEEKRPRGVPLAVTISLILHAFFIAYILFNHQSASQAQAPEPMVRYIQLMRQNKEFMEAPGPKTDTAPITAPYSDANRKASMPKPTGDQQTKRPGEGGFYTPPRSIAGTPAAQQQQQQAQQQSAPPQRPAAETADAQAPATQEPTFSYRPQQANAAAKVDWNAAIREVGKIASLGTGQESLGLGNGGGEKGYAESGPVSFESQWYDWGPYAESMVTKIRVNWYNNMPRLIQTGMRGVVTIRFTIQRDGTITNLEILSSSTIPPYDFAAKKAIEISSALAPLPKDFPNPTERVTCMFFYNQEPPAR